MGQTAGSWYHILGSMPRAVSIWFTRPLDLSIWKTIMLTTSHDTKYGRKMKVWANFLSQRLPISLRKIARASALPRPNTRNSRFRYRVFAVILNQSPLAKKNSKFLNPMKSLPKMPLSTR